MATLFVTGLFVIVAIASALALADAWFRGRYVFEQLLEERALLEQGFVPVAAEEPAYRLRAGAVNRMEPRRRPTARAQRRTAQPLFGYGAA